MQEEKTQVQAGDMHRLLMKFLILVIVTEFVQQIRKKDKAAVTALYSRYGRKLLGFAVSKWMMDEDEAWELVYKTLYKVIEVIDRYSFETESRFNGFVFQVFINNLRNHYHEKKKKRVETVALQEKHGNTDAGEKNEEKENIYMRCLKKILEQFEDWKRVLMLMKAQDFSYEEISAYVNRPAGQLKVYYMRAKQVLTEKVNECINNPNT